MKRFLWACASVAALSTPALAQSHIAYKTCMPIVDESREGNPADLVCSGENDIVSIGQRIGNSKADTLTAPVSVIGRDFIDARGASYVTDLLRTLPGLSVNQSGPAGSLTQIRMRGSEASHTLVLIDGVEVSNPASGEFDFSGLRADDVVKIEVLRGEQSALYGSDAIAGVINIITLAGETGPKFRASVEGGSFSTFNSQVSAVIPIKSAALSVNGNVFQTDGYDISGLGGEDDGSQSRSLNVGLNRVDMGGLTLSGKFGFSTLLSEFDSDSDFDGRLNNMGDESTRETYTARLDGRFNAIGFNNLLTANFNEITTDTNGAFDNISVGTREQFSWAAKREVGELGALTILAETEQESYTITPNFSGNPDAPENRNSALAADYQYSRDTWSFSASARRDFNDRFEDATTWRVGAGYNFPWDARARISVGEGVKNPSLIELFGFYPAQNFTGNPDLKPETSLGYNIGYEQSFSGGSVSIDYFKSELEDEIFTDFSGFLFLPRNRLTDSTREGVEIEGRWLPVETFNVRGSATVLRAEENGVTEIRRPEFFASAAAVWTPTDSLSLTVSADHTGEQLDTNFGSFSVVTLEAFTLVAANLRYTLGENWSVNLRGENLLDEDYQEVFGYASQDRGVYFGLSADF
ncbi:TonB-dependent receptor plug domain-containing protein [Robiginitomaculum antarcticum]|uniref:TonB-dependent receptor plug domain-containing protein n=1 Tax=Robiginitomaculum antarcticum TaxID=437507 RepID=UPI00037183F2|nr:TonB-dependent receptor [Robiginitomaculum antarcticum]